MYHLPDSCMYEWQDSLLFLMDEQRCWCICPTFPHLLVPSWALGCSHVSALVDSVVVALVCRWPFDTEFVSFGFILKSGLSASDEGFWILEALPSVFPGDENNSHSRQECAGLPLSTPHAGYHFVLFCMSVMVSDVEQVFIHRSAICMSSFETCPFGTFAHF